MWYLYYFLTVFLVRLATTMQLWFWGNHTKLLLTALSTLSLPRNNKKVENHGGAASPEHNNTHAPINAMYSVNEWFSTPCANWPEGIPSSIAILQSAGVSGFDRRVIHLLHLLRTISLLPFGESSSTIDTNDMTSLVKWHHGYVFSSPSLDLPIAIVIPCI